MYQLRSLNVHWKVLICETEASRRFRYWKAIKRSHPWIQNLESLRQCSRESFPNGNSWTFYTQCLPRYANANGLWAHFDDWKHLNPSKSEIITFFNPRSKPLRTLAESIGSISVAGSPIKLQTSIKNLGVYLDSRLSFDKQVSEICKASYFHIRALRHIRSSLTTEAAKTIASAIIVGSRLDYCNSLLAGTSVSNLAHLQPVQNTLARVVARKSRFDHITPVLSGLHWLPICHRINFKIATITYRMLQPQQPSYLAALIPRYTPVRSLRSSSSLSICVPLRKTSIATSRSFPLSQQNFGIHQLPGHLSSIPTLPACRRGLKHHLFLHAYPDSRTLVAPLSWWLH